MAFDRKAARTKRRAHIRKRVVGTEARPRLSVFRSSRHIYAQVIDDSTGRTLAEASTLTAGELRDQGGNIEAAKAVGELLAQRALAAGVSAVCFDRGGFLFHGRVKALADAARGAGLNF